MIKGNLLDFEAPIYMNENQRDNFIDRMKNIFKNRVYVTNLIENKKEIKNIDRHPKKFTEEDSLILADSKLSNEEIAKIVNKSAFAIQMKRGSFLMELQEWARKNGKTRITEDDVRGFLREEK